MHMIHKLATGYFARASERGHRAISTHVHVVEQGGKVWCGYKPHRTMEFQWCAWGTQLDYIKCPKCLRMAQKARFQQLQYQLATLPKQSSYGE